MPATPDTNINLNNDTDLDELYDEAVRFVTESNKYSIADIQKKFLIGYNRAAVLVERMKETGVLDDIGSLQEK